MTLCQKRSVAPVDRLHEPPRVTDLIPYPQCRLQVTLLSHHISLGISQLEPVAFDRLVFKLYAHPPGFVIPIPLQLHVSR